MASRLPGGRGSAWTDPWVPRCRSAAEAGFRGPGAGVSGLPAEGQILFVRGAVILSAASGSLSLPSIHTYRGGSESVAVRCNFFLFHPLQHFPPRRSHYRYRDRKICFCGSREEGKRKRVEALET